MKKILIAITAVVISSNVYASKQETDEGNWQRTFKLKNGATITHTPEAVTMNLGGFNMTVGKEFEFSKGSSINGISPSDDGSLLAQTSIEKFRKEVKKYGEINSEE